MDMRKIMTRFELERKTRRNQWIVGGLLMLIMVLSTAGYALNSENKTTKTDIIDYRGTRFIKSDSYWYFNSAEQNLMTAYNPKETENISFILTRGLTAYKDKPLYFVGNFQEANNELKRNLNPFVLRIQDACLINENCTDNLPAKNCSTDNVMIIKEPKKENDKEKVYEIEKCIFIIANLENQTKAADAVLFKILNI